MNNSTIKTFLFLLPLIFCSCNTPSPKYVDLGKLSVSFDVSAFYEQKINKTNAIIKKDPKTLDKKTALDMLDNPFFVKDTLVLFNSGGSFPTDMTLESKNDWLNRNNKPIEIVGYEYRTMMYNEDRDTLASLNTVIFRI